LPNPFPGKLIDYRDSQAKPLVFNACGFYQKTLAEYLLAMKPEVREWDLMFFPLGTSGAAQLIQTHWEQELKANT
jgi:hypothetical protein